MRFIPLLLLVSFMLTAQPRENKPLPYFTKKPTSVMKDDIVGWSLSLDGQWISKENTLLPRYMSQNKAKYSREASQLGLDNIQELMIFPVQYGKDTLMMLVKFYREGSYRYKVTKKGWRNYTSAYYFLFDDSELSKLNNVVDVATQNLTIQLLDGGKITDVSKGNIISRIKQVIKPREDYERNLILMVQPYTQASVVRFHVYSYHEVFKDVEGVRKDFVIDGESLYGSPKLFEYMYYETPIDNFSDFFAYPTTYEFDID